MGRRRAHGARARQRRAAGAARPQVGVPAGNLLAAAVLGLLAWLLPEAAFESWGWRIPFLLSAVLIVVGLWIRLAIAESPLFADVERSHTRARAPILDLLRVYPREVLVAIGARLGVDVAALAAARETAHAPLTVEKPAERAILEHPEVYPSDVVGTGGRPQRRPG